MKHIAIYGALSDIAVALARQLASDDYELSLVARNKEALDIHAKDLILRGAGKINLIDADFSENNNIDRITQEIATPDIAIIAWGTLPDQKNCNDDSAECEKALLINAVQPIRLSQILASQMEKRGSGTLIGIGSPAGDRGRNTNYIYGAAKSAFATAYSGLRQRLAPAGIKVTLIKPGFVTTKMTEGFEREGPLWTSPDIVAKRIIKALKQDKAVIYVPFYWRFILLIIQHLPDFVFNRINI